MHSEFAYVHIAIFVEIACFRFLKSLQNVPLRLFGYQTHSLSVAGCRFALKLSFFRVTMLRKLSDVFFFLLFGSLSNASFCSARTTVLTNCSKKASLM